MDRNLELLRTYVLDLPGPKQFEDYSINLCIIMHFEGKNHLRKNVSANMRRKILDENLMENNSQMANFEMTLFQCSVLLH